MNFKKAFTLAEILIVVIIISVIALIMLKTIKPASFTEKANLANAQKAIAAMEKAFNQLLDMESTNCPMKTFMYKPAGTSTWEYACTTALDSSEEYRDTLKKYIKYDKVANFCTMSNACPAGTTDFAAIRLPGGIVIGVRPTDVDASIGTNCIQSFTPGEAVRNPASQKFNKTTGALETAKCWGELWIDVNGKESPNTEGSDFFKIGLGESGLEK